MPADIRKYTDGDLQSILDINMLAFAPIHASFACVLGEDIFRRVWPDWKASNAAYIRSLAEGVEAERLFVAETPQAIVGFVHFTMDFEKKCGQIGLNAVHPDEQGKGYGKQMYRFVLRLMRDAGIEVVQVSTGGDDAHAGARRCYESCGFKPFPNVSYSLFIGENPVGAAGEA